MRLTRGHTNQSFANGDDRVVRRAWPGKPATQIAAEQRVLAALAGSAPCDTPRLVEPEHVDAEGCVVHVFSRCRGTPGPHYLEPGDTVRMVAAMSRLAELHRALAVIPCDVRDPWHWLRARLASVMAGDLTVLPFAADRMLAKIAALLPASAETDAQWLHGDYHLGNLLWTDDTVTGIVDFDDTGCGSATSEAVLAAFALARQPTEEMFDYDRALLAAGLAAYGVAIASPGSAGARSSAAGAAESIDGTPFEAVFCAYQVLIHLGAVQRGLWPLALGIGFWPCWGYLARI